MRRKTLLHVTYGTQVENHCFRLWKQAWHSLALICVFPVCGEKKRAHFTVCLMTQNKNLFQIFTVQLQHQEFSEWKGLIFFHHNSVEMLTNKGLAQTNSLSKIGAIFCVSELLYYFLKCAISVYLFIPNHAELMDKKPKYEIQMLMVIFLINIYCATKFIY